MSKKMLSNILLLITAIIWGSSFVAQKAGMEYVEPFTYSGVRMLIGSLVLAPVVFIINKNKQKKLDEKPSEEEIKKTRRFSIQGGVLCGLALFVASNLQQFGVNYTTAGKAGFITVLYIAFVPIISLIIGKKVRPIMWLCVLLGAIGFYMLSLAGQSFSLSLGDGLVLLCAIAFAVHIMTVDHFAPKMDGLLLSCLQFLTTGVLSCICMLIFETPKMDAIIDCAVPILYSGVLSCGIAYTLQVVAQKWADPTVASLLMSLESVFAAISGALFLGESMTFIQLLGCIVIFIAVIVSNLPEKKTELK